MDALDLDNDTRGWIMSLVSGIACVVGASVICVDLLVRHIPGKRDFKIEESNIFLASSLSLSFGVMLFSALVGMYPSSKNYLRKAGHSASATGWIILGCFIAGFIGIQVISRFLHGYMPSHVVDCDHNHGEINSEGQVTGHQHTQSRSQSHEQDPPEPPNKVLNQHGNDALTESSPLLKVMSNYDGSSSSKPSKASKKRSQKAYLRNDATERSSLDGQVVTTRRPSMVEVQRRVLSFVKDTKNNCDEEGPCFGYSGPCGHECFKHIGKSQASSRRTSVVHTTTSNRRRNRRPSDVSKILGHNQCISESSKVSKCPSGDFFEELAESAGEEDLEAQHHHHVPENPFLSIGLQTSIAIALHKLPEGFITYATNHANPSLGFTVFMALFIHNITEGFAMALPLYLALGSRVRAMFWSSLLGGISQPLGAGIAALWFKLAQHTNHDPGFVAYGCMFAVTAGIMTSVSIQLFMESLSLNHNSNLVTGFALVGMAIMGTSTALTAE